jgi:queuine tRNA-ribosyltransferase
MYAMTEIVTAILPQNKPRYLMGVGTPVNILENIALGIDMFDCVMPTRNARNGMLFTAHGSINIKNKKWEDDFSPIDEMGITFVDTEYLQQMSILGNKLRPFIISVFICGWFVKRENIS